MKYLITCLLLFIASIAFSQNSNPDSPEVKNSTIEFNGGKYNGYLIEFNAPPDIVEDAVKERFKLQGVKPKETKGFMVYRNVVMPLIDPVKPMDAFVKVERKSRKEKEQTIVYFIAALPGQIPEDKLKSDAAEISGAVAVIEKGNAFLTGIIPDVRQGVYDKDIANQQSLLKKEEKKLANLVDDQTDMEKKLKKLQSDIEYNKKAQERQTAEIEKAKNALNELISKNPKGGQ
ncbi:MAG: hypothetical protein ABI760_15100 [Ferruginibacter sp.]